MRAEPPGHRNKPALGLRSGARLMGAEARTSRDMGGAVLRATNANGRP